MSGSGRLLVAFEYRGEWEPISETSHLSTALVFVDEFRDLGRVALFFSESGATIVFPKRDVPAHGWPEAA